ncbi:recombinase family protein [Anaerotignum sp.]|uniref:recombinase family protein n=1 Tax=Anaerotignum sp. TaxID=2039241 RepID=UPI002714D3CE|nr:recombinase family protein [Anaerotignum sp.]
MEQKIGIYLRLSDEDENPEESVSVKGQRELIQHYILHHRDLSSYEILEFCDDGYSGTNFNRPGVMKLLQKARNGEVFCIMVKDFSRFGRNYIEVGNYIEQVFPFWGVRFISINDNFDSGRAFGNGDFMGISFQNLMYDLYSKDLSQKITSVRRSKAEQGKFITAFAPYGYGKSKEQKLVIDKEAASVVQRIFKMALAGIPQIEIARYLNSEEIPSPLKLRKMRKEPFFCTGVSKQFLWSPATIGRILNDQRYAGDSVYGKVKPKKIGSREDKKVPKQEWIIVPNTHEPIIGRDIYEQVQAKGRNYQPRKKEKPYPLWKKVRCGGCHYMMSRKISEENGSKGSVAVYRCPKLVFTNGVRCYGEKIAEHSIEDAILFYLNKLMVSSNAGELEEYFNGQSKERIQKNKKLIKQQEEKLKKIGLAKIELYEAYKENKLGKDDFLMKKNGYQDLYEKIESALLLEQEKSGYSQFDFPKNQEDMLRLNKIFPYPSLTRELVDVFVDVIFIEQNGAIKILWNFQDVFTK